MASSCNSHFLMPRIRLQLLALLCTLTSLYSVTECSDVIQLRGEVGGNVTFQCPVDESRPLEFCYFQTTSSNPFVNGYYDSKDMTPYLSYLWNNTRMANNTVMYMYDLTVAHGIDYKCIFKYKSSKAEPEIKIRLTVTAKYSKPEVTVRCGVEGNDLSCLVTCTSHGGYPDSEVMWDAAENQKCKIVNNSKKTDAQMLVTRSSTAYFNCTNGNVTSSRCSVGHVSSDEFTVCMTKDPQKSPGNVVMFAIVVAIATLFITVIAVLCYLRKRKGGNGGAELRIEVNGCNPTELDTLRSTEEV